MIGLSEGDPSEILGWLEDSSIFPPDQRDLTWNFYANYYRRRLPKTLRGHTGPIRCLTLSGDGRTLITGSFDRTVRIWDVGLGQKRAETQSQLKHKD